MMKIMAGAFVLLLFCISFVVPPATGAELTIQEMVELGTTKDPKRIKDLTDKLKEPQAPPPSKPDALDDTALHKLCDACNKGDLAAVHRLITDGAPINAACGDDSPLSSAAFRGHYAIVLHLLNHRADPNFRPEYGLSALFDAVRAHHGSSIPADRTNSLLIATLLIERGADTDLRSPIEETPLMYAAQNGDLEMVLFLLQHSANINSRTPEGATALSLARKKAHLEVVRALLDLGAK